jgi:hypothetical protein
MANATQEAARLYVSAPSDLDLRPLLDGLKRRGTQPYVLSDVVPLGSDILESLRLAIRRADRILVVLSNPPQAPSSSPDRTPAQEGPRQGIADPAQPLLRRGMALHQRPRRGDRIERRGRGGQRRPRRWLRPRRLVRRFRSNCGNPLLVELKQPLGPGRGEPGSPRPRCAPDGTTCVDRVSRAGGRGSATASGRAQRGPDSPF